MDSNTFSNTVGLIIDNLECGYYHPLMLKDGRVKDQRYSKSGETMFGIDRKAGGTINDSAAGKQFWSLIDRANAKNKWKWNYKGGELGSQLKDLAAQIMLPQYESMSKKYLSPKAKSLVESDNRLLFNFVYASWNGSGWFKSFATKINEAIQKGITNPNQLTEIAVAARTQSQNSLIAQGGNKIAELMERLKGLSKAGENLIRHPDEIAQTGKEFLNNPVKTTKRHPLRVAAFSIVAIAGLTAIIYIATMPENKKAV